MEGPPVEPLAPPPPTVEYPRGFATAGATAPTPSMRNAASWLYWIAGLTVVNSAFDLFGGEFHFAVGLVTTSLVNVVAMKFGAVAIAAAILFDLVACGAYVFLGWEGGKGKVWALGVALGLLIPDTLIMLLAGTEMLLGLAFHGWVIYRLIHAIRSRRNEPAIG